MDYANGIIFDSDPSLREIHGHPLLGIKCYTTTAGRGTTIGSNKICKQDNSLKNIGTVHSSAIADQTGSYSGEMGLSHQIQRVSGISYSNKSIENYFRESSKKKDLTQFEDIDEGPKSSNADPFSKNTPSISSKPTAPTSTKRKPGKLEFRKLDLSPSVGGSTVLNSGGRPAEKKKSDFFNQPQTFDPFALIKETKQGLVRIGSKSDFPSL